MSSRAVPLWAYPSPRAARKSLTMAASIAAPSSAPAEFSKPSAMRLLAAIPSARVPSSSSVQALSVRLTRLPPNSSSCRADLPTAERFSPVSGSPSASGGMASGVTVSSGGSLNVSAGGLTLGESVNSGGKLTIASGGTDIGLSVSPGGSAIVLSGGTLELLSGNTTSGTTLLAGATLEVTSGAILSGQTVSKGVTVVVLSGSTAESLNVKAGGVEIISAGGFES